MRWEVKFGFGNSAGFSRRALHWRNFPGSAASWLLTLQAVGVQEVLALLVTLDAALDASHSLPSDAPEEALALVAVGRRRRRPGDEVVRGGRGDRVDHRLEGFLVHVHLLRVYDRANASPLEIAALEV